MTLSASMTSIVVTLVLAWSYQAARPEREASMDNTITVRIADKAFVATLANTPPRRPSGSCCRFQSR